VLQSRRDAGADNDEGNFRFFHLSSPANHFGEVNLDAAG
jgi:hypothetical protein